MRPGLESGEGVRGQGRRETEEGSKRSKKNEKRSKQVNKNEFSQTLILVPSRL